MKSLCIGVVMYIIAQTVAWFQTNGAIISKWMGNNIILMSIVCGPIVGAFFAYGTKYIFEETGKLWVARFLGFASGYMIFIPLTWFFLGETPFTLKNIISIILCCAIIAVQLLMK
tara:strand:+ start:174 stop:518 length:345 start_codon:yes stop_codon:yes gene_type:complete